MAIQQTVNTVGISNNAVYGIGDRVLVEFLGKRCQGVIVAVRYGPGGVPDYTVDLYLRGRRAIFGRNVIGLVQRAG